jgi:hypothetical protein
MRKSVALILIPVLLGIPAVLICRAVWPPDILSGRKLELATLTTRRGDQLHLTQVFNGDGYLTSLTQVAPDGTRWDITIDPDAMKSWIGTLLPSTNADIVDVKVCGLTYRYDWVSKTFTRRDGTTVKAYGLGK